MNLQKGKIYIGFAVLLRYMGKYKRDIIILSIMGVISAIGNGTIPYIAGKFFDAVTGSAAVTFMDQTMPLYIAVLALWTVIQLATYFMDWRINIMSEYFSNAVWLDYLANGFGFLLLLPMSFHKKHKIGEIGNKIGMAAGSLETIAGRIVIDLAPQILSIVIALGIAFYMKPIMAALLLAGLIVYLFVLVRKIKPLAGYQKAYYDIVSTAVWGDNYDTIGNAIAVKQATAEEYERAKMSRNAKKALPLWMRLTKVWGNLSLYQRLTILSTQVVIFILSAIFIRAGTMTIGELIAFNAYAAMIFGPFVTIARNWQTIQNGVVNINETEKILEMEPENYRPKRAVDFEIKGGISFRNVSFQYDSGKPVLEDISFEVKPGEVVALVGESGVGKSTLVDLVSGYHFPDKGTVAIDGHDIREVDLRKLRSKIAVVPQEVVLFNDTIEMNIKYGNFEAPAERLAEAARKADAVGFIEKFPDKWRQLVGERGIKLSVGQKQRVSIARAILRDPVILILDEPTSALDAGTEKTITGSLDGLMRGKTTFIIAHRLSTVRRADIILVFKGGKIIERGRHEELLKIAGGEYRRLYELQIGLHG
ncbi:ABC transporter ATP-binding protein/permease [Patescibacteria group bacterium]|nr:ABC transporter ATP-binding protein/permease [Patescibacteria group bacterium]MDE1946766.1 ABC transporter ATP-binding protein [Patescibacteria group bacterium]MDE2010931.1 ABC transporter ATP-binding protein [Patescibacteria group bacterium]MDE2233614.1 ABC transporter ATP-binding protein [Patescibacteria group bacterium]